MSGPHLNCETAWSHTLCLPISLHQDTTHSRPYNNQTSLLGLIKGILNSHLKQNRSLLSYSCSVIARWILLTQLKGQFEFGGWLIVPIPSKIQQKICIWELFYYYKIIAEVGGRGKDTTNSKRTLQGVPVKMSMRHFFLGDLVLLFSFVAWGGPYGFSDFVREPSSCLSSHLMLVTVSKSVRGMYVCLKI